jgi:catechol-2,3-dioxygenase
VDSPATVDAWHRWLISNGVDVVGPVDHKIIYSIYFYDPNGIRLELTTPIDPTWNNNPVAARESLREWEQVKATARETGQDMSVVLAELTRQRSHRKAE